MKKQPGVATDSNTSVTALSVSPTQDDHLALERIFGGFKWVLHKADCGASALSLLYRHHIGVVLCDGDTRRNTWIDMLEQLMALRNAPLLIVTSRLADDRLWAEALNLGAYDVLAKPLDEQEVLRVVRAAWQHWQHSFRMATTGGRKVRTATG